MSAIIIQLKVRVKFLQAKNGNLFIYKKQIQKCHPTFQVAFSLLLVKQVTDV
ncbi:hypothetical protein [Oceanobacillus sojae]|uniref:hypothetical protein n=1 Tax=Oceanobacillus sojae TaxID=582851 RepID=UPI00158B9AD3|nr:hypothetical protein [Oceanobacillus sojae]MCT1905450.1 hypothetical protein [Oceanobacillus sojae]